MARKYCLEYGVLEPQEAAKLLKEVGRKKWSLFSLKTQVVSMDYRSLQRLQFKDDIWKC